MPACLPARAQRVVHDSTQWTTRSQHHHHHYHHIPCSHMPAGAGSQHPTTITTSPTPYSHMPAGARLLALLLLVCGSALLASAWTLPLNNKLQPTSLRLAHQRKQQLAMSGSKSVLFICLGNICRSPSAEAVFKAVVEKEGKASFRIDSCGTGGGNPNWYQKGGWSYHEGESADSRMRAAASARGIDITSRSRPLNAKDIEEFDLLICMDGSNKSAVLEAADHWGKYQQAAEKVRLMTEYCTKHIAKSVPDPYYGGSDGFERVLDLLEDACEGLLESMK